jgi:hypothetical protein
MNQITASQPMILYFVGEELERLKELNMTRKFSIYASKPPVLEAVANYDDMIPSDAPPNPPEKKTEPTENQGNKGN